MVLQHLIPALCEMRLFGTMNHRISFLTLFSAVFYSNFCYGQAAKNNLSLTYSPDKIIRGERFNVTCKMLATVVDGVDDMDIQKSDSTKPTGYKVLVRMAVLVDEGLAKVITDDKRVSASGSVYNQSVTAIYTGAICSDTGEYFCLAHWKNPSKVIQVENQTVNILILGACKEEEESYSGSNFGFIIGITALVIILILLLILVALIALGKKTDGKGKKKAIGPGGCKDNKRGTHASIVFRKKSQSTAPGASPRKISNMESVGLADSTTQVSSAASTLTSTASSAMDSKPSMDKSSEADSILFFQA